MRTTKHTRNGNRMNEYAFSATPHGAKSFQWIFDFLCISFLLSPPPPAPSSEMRSLIAAKWDFEFRSEHQRFNCDCDAQQPKQDSRIHSGVPWTHENARERHPTPAKVYFWNFVNCVAHHLVRATSKLKVIVVAVPPPSSSSSSIQPNACDIHERQKHLKRFAHQITIKTLINVKLCPSRDRTEDIHTFRSLRRAWNAVNEICFQFVSVKFFPQLFSFVSIFLHFCFVQRFLCRCRAKRTLIKLIFVCDEK